MSLLIVELAVVFVIVSYAVYLRVFYKLIMDEHVLA